MLGFFIANSEQLD